MATSTVQKTSSLFSAPNGQQWHELSVDQTFQAVETTAEGLSSQEHQRRLEECGPNGLPTSDSDEWYVTLAKQFRSPMVLFLAVAAVVTAVLQEWFDVLVIVLVLLLNASIGFWQARKAERDVKALQELSAPTATVIRAGEQSQIPASDVVPGDVLYLESGDQIAADVRILESNGLQVDESMLTGEAMAVSKHDEVLEADISLGDRINMGYSGTLVISGRARGVVVATGTDTELGHIAELVSTESAKTPLQILTDQLERNIAYVILGVAIVTFISSLIMGTTIGDTFLITVALVVSAMPEALPIVLSVAMGVGVSRMAKHRAVVRQLHSVETLGSTTVIGSDKTGTLTVNRMTVEQLWTPDAGTVTISGENREELEDYTAAQTQCLRTGALTNDAVPAAEGDRDGADADSEGTDSEGSPLDLIGDAVDVAMAVSGLESEQVTSQERGQTPMASMPYEPELAYSQTIRTDPDGTAVLHAKGAPETILDFCTVDEETAHKARKAVSEMAHRGLRVIATAHRQIADDELDELVEEFENSQAPTPTGMKLSGLQAMMDPPREGVEDAIAQCREAGVHVMMITGDHPTTAAAIADRLGLAPTQTTSSRHSEAESVITGTELAELSDPELVERLPQITVAARMSPQDKLRVVKVLQEQDKIVAITGDGVNDAPALKAASIGVAMGKSGTDVAREASDVVLTDDNFVTIVEAVRQGRITFSSIRKATFFLLSNGLAALIAVAVNTFTELPLIFLPVMLLFMNVVTNGIQDIALAFEKGEGDELDQSPRPRSEGVLNRTMWLRTVITGTWMGVGTLLVYRMAHEAGLELDHCRTLALITMVMFNFFQVFSARAERQSVFRLNPFSNPLLLISALAALGLQWLASSWEPIADLIGLTALSATEWLMCTAIGSTVLLIVEGEKLVRRLAHRGSADG